jgi:phage-related protein
MKGIRFGLYHSSDDFGLILSKKEMGAPNVKTKTIDVEGADGVLDLTDFFGEPKYDNVTHKFEFTTLASMTEFLSLFSRIKNAIHGKKVRIILDDDPTFFYMGRCFVSSFTSEKGVGTVSVECECEPYKYRIAKTVVTQAVEGTQSITLTNGRKRAVPEVSIDTTGSMNIVYQESNVWDLGAGSYTLPELELTEGENIVTVTGTGTISFTWQEAML